MTKFVYLIKDEVGIHGRPAGMLAKKCAEFKSSITLSCKGKTADGKKIMPVMSLGAKKGDKVEVSIDGADEAAAKSTLEKFFKENF